MLLERYTALYRHAFELEQYTGQLGTENDELRHVLECTLQEERRAAAAAAGGGGGGGGGTAHLVRSSSSGMPALRLSTTGSASPIHPSCTTPVSYDGCLVHHTSAALQDCCDGVGLGVGWGVFGTNG